MRFSFFIFMMCLLLSLLSCDWKDFPSYELDQSVGKASVDGATVEVVDALAVVKNLSLSTTGSVDFHLSAPEVSVLLSCDSATITSPVLWTLSFENSMNDASLTFSEGATLLSEVRNGLTVIAEIEVTTPELTISVESHSGDSTDGYSFAFFSDIQDGIDQVGDLYEAINDDPSILFVLSSGDLASSGLESQLDAVVGSLVELKIPFFATLGNHDVAGGGARYWRTLFGLGTYSFSYGEASFHLLDSSSSFIEEPLFEKLKAGLQASSVENKFYFEHHPIVDPYGIRGGSLSSRDQAYLLLGELAKHNVDALFFGHIHSYYKSDLAGMSAYISGGAGAIPEEFDDIERHYLKITVAGDGSGYSVSLHQID